MTTVDLVRRRLVESQHREWIDRLHVKTAWPTASIVDQLIAADCDRARLHAAYALFAERDNMNPFVDPPVHIRFLRFLEEEARR